MALTFIEKDGDLFECSSTASLAHCVSEDLAMGKGIAVEFKNRFGKVDELKKQGATVGQYAVLKDNCRYIYYLVTKKTFNSKPNETSLKYCLREMRDHMLQNNVDELCMPRIGCGLDDLSWDNVKELIKSVFKDCPITLTIYNKEDCTEICQTGSYVEKRGSLFESPENCSLAHLVGEDLVMRKGLANDFLNRFGRVDELKSQNAKVGQCAILRDNSRYIYYIIGKHKCNTPLIEFGLKQALISMRDHCHQYGIKQLAMPKLGTGLNNWPWAKVSLMINDVFKDSDIQLIIYSL